MDQLAYLGVNTTIRLLEQQLLNKDEFETLVKAPTIRVVLEGLQKTVYQADVTNLLETKQFEQLLMTSLVADYQTIIKEVPDKEIIQLFTSSYVYHNTKVLLKQQFSGKELHHLCIPIGISINTLERLVQLGDVDGVSPSLLEAVHGAISEYEEFHRLEAADVFMDTYYFKELRMLEKQLNNDTVTHMVNTMIDLYNVETLIRARKQKKSRAFLQTVLSSSGTVDKHQLIDSTEQENWEGLLELFDQVSYKDELATILLAETVETAKVERLKDQVIYQLLQDATFEAFGPLPVLAYLHAKEMEVKNLRLLLIGKDNGFSEEQLRERMRPIYEA